VGYYSKTHFLSWLCTDFLDEGQTFSSSSHPKISKCSYHLEVKIIMLLSSAKQISISTMFQLYRGGQFY
jgi:hypothetical protein